jgi:hypothetical protein
MDPENETTDETTTTDESADETATSASPADDASSPADSPAEETKEVELTPEQIAEREKKAKQESRIKAAEAAEKAAEARRQAKRKQLEEQEREERIRAREAEANRLIEQARSAMQELEQRKAAVIKGGYEGLKALGIEYGDWTKKTLEETAPDAVAQRALQRIEQLEAEIRRREEAEQHRVQRAREEAERANAQKRFEDFLDSNADDFPEAATLPSKVTHILAAEVAREYHREHGTWPSFAALLPRLDKKAKEFHDEQKTKSAKRVRSNESPSDGKSTPPQASPGHPASSPAHRTLTPAVATTKATPRRQMTAEEEDEWALAELRQAMAADTKQARADNS